MNILLVGNRLMGDALDALHAFHSLIVHYERMSEMKVRYSFLGYQYSYFVHETLMSDLELTFENVYYLENYLKTPKITPQTTPKVADEVIHKVAQKGTQKNTQKSAQKSDRDVIGKHYPRVNLSWGALRQLIRALRNDRYDLAVIMPGGIIFALLTFLAGIKVRIGHRSDGRALLLTRTVPIYKTCANFENWANVLKLLTPMPAFSPYFPRKRSFLWDTLSDDLPFKQVLKKAVKQKFNQKLKQADAHGDVRSESEWLGAADRQMPKNILHPSNAPHPSVPHLKHPSVEESVEALSGEAAEHLAEHFVKYGAKSSIQPSASKFTEEAAGKELDEEALMEGDVPMFTRADWGRYYVVASQASESWRVWSGDKFYRLATYLEEHYQLQALWVGMEAEYAAVETLRQGLGFNLCGKLSWHNLLALLGQTRFLVTNDTGIAHIGTLLCETFIIFGPSNPIMASPYVRGNRLTKILPPNGSIPFEKRKEKRYRTALNIEQISLEMVTTAIEKKLRLI